MHNTGGGPGPAPRVDLLAAGAAGDRELVEELVGVINGAYATGEDGLWREGWTRTTPDEVAKLILDGGMLVARVDGRVAGCGHVRPLDESTADLGFVSTAPEQWGGGVGGEIVRAAEELMRLRGVATMQLELLVPRDGTHPHKDRVREWYVRLGYRSVRTAPFEEVATHATAQLAIPCEFLVFEKSLVA
jgi:GNAT superfamily N-acetyltransferase